MPKKKNALRDTRRGENEETNGTPAPSSELIEAKPLSNAELKTLFRTWQASTEQVDKARADLEGKLLARSKIVEQIAAGAGKGPFGYKGQVLTISCRVNKTTGESTWFFKGPSKSDLTEVS